MIYGKGGCSYITSQINKEIFLARDAFNIFDRDKDGFVDIQEIFKVSSTMGFNLDIEDLKICMNEVDMVTANIPFPNHK